MNERMRKLGNGMQLKIECCDCFCPQYLRLLFSYCKYFVSLSYCDIISCSYKFRKSADNKKWQQGRVKSGKIWNVHAYSCLNA